MAEIQVPFDNDGKIVLQLPAKMSGRRLDLELTKTNDPARAINNGLARLARHLTSLLDALKAVEDNPRPDTKETTRILEAWEDIAYTATEVFESYQSKLSHAVTALGRREQKGTTRDYITLVKKYRNHWSFLANKIKHENNHLAPVTQCYEPSLRVVHGYSLICPVGTEGMDVNKQYHKGKERCRSYNLELRQLVYDLLRVDRAASTLIQGLPDDLNADPLPPYNMTWDVGEQLGRILKRPMWPLPDESRVIDGYRITREHLTTERQAAALMLESGRMSVQFTGDGVTRTFPIV